MVRSLAFKSTILSALFSIGVSYGDVPCVWQSKTGSHFDLRSLVVTAQTAASYSIVDGDIPCTPETEPSFSYVWNMCSTVTTSSIPQTCTDMNKAGAVMQYLDFMGTHDCYVIGKYDPENDDSTFSLLDVTDPSKGVSVKYGAGEKCSTSSQLRTSTIDIMCANVKATVVSAQEPTPCNYHLVMKSVYGCPTECPVTGNGLCNSHGLCKYDPAIKAPRCYCNNGHYGSSCSETTASTTSSYDGFSVQLGLLITLLLIAIGLVAVVIYMVYKITVFRKQSAESSGSSEMVETVHF